MTSSRKKVDVKKSKIGAASSAEQGEESQSVILADAETQTEEEQSEQEATVAKVFSVDKDIYNDGADCDKKQMILVAGRNRMMMMNLIMTFCKDKTG